MQTTAFSAYERVSAFEIDPAPLDVPALIWSPSKGCSEPRRWSARKWSFRALITVAGW